MRKLWIALLLALLLALPAAAADEDIYETAGDLYEAWCEDCPDFICGVWSTDGSPERLTFGVQEGPEGEAAQAEILALVRDDSTVSFAVQTYSRNELLALQTELEPWFHQDCGMISTALDDMSNCIRIGIDESRREDADTLAFMSELRERYGDRIAFEYTGPIVLSTQEIPVKTLETPGNNFQTVTYDAPETGAPWAWLSLLLLPLLGLGAAFLLRRRKSLVLQTAEGNTVSDAPLSTARLARMVKEAAPTPAPSLDARILSAVDKE